MSETGRMLLDLLILFVSARVAGALFERFRQPAVVGELLVGMLIGAHVLGLIHESQFQDLFAELGVVILLFVVGLETEPTSLLRVGRQAAMVGTAGVLVPFALGFGLMQIFGRTINEALFVGAALTATSVGITARVMSDLKQLGTQIAQIILGAAVFDDILGLLVLAVVSGLVAGELLAGKIAILVVEVVAFCALALMLGRPAIRRICPRLPPREEETSRDHLFGLALAICFAFSALADVIGLAAIVGAFFAGIIFAEIPEAPTLRRAMHPIYEFLVPIFFVLMGARVDLPLLLSGKMLVLGLFITLVAIIGKLIGCGLGALSAGRWQAFTIGVGMIPRGEVGIVVALVGLSRGVISTDLYSQVILMSMLTSLLAPPLLKLLLQRQQPAAPATPLLEDGRP